jgi:glycogen debranching enzyme
MEEVLQVGDRFYILATPAKTAELSRVLKHGDTFALFDPRGDIVTQALREHGLYHQGTRFLSQLRLQIGHVRPLLLSSRVRSDNDGFAADLTNSDLVIDGNLVVERDLLHVYRSRFVLDGHLYESLRLANYGASPVLLPVTIDFDADFVDIFEIRGTARGRRGTVLTPQISPADVVLSYRGLDKVERRTHLIFETQPDALSSSHAEFHVTLAPHQEMRLRFAVHCAADATVPQDAPDIDRAASLLNQQFRSLATRQGRVSTDDEAFNEWLERSAADLRMMISQTPHGPYPYAGVPWFNTVFGRDGIITALSTLTIDPALARGVLAHLAASQATSSSPDQDAEPGKILHEARGGEMAALGEVPFGRYYGSVDSTPLFLVLAGRYFERTADRAFIDRLWPHILRALEWIDRYGDRDGDGFVEYARRTPAGLVQQGWKDSKDSVFHADGTLAEPPIALCEVQGYVFDAKRKVAALARARGNEALARQLETGAERLRARFEDAFWCDDLGTYALALDGNKQPCRVRSSNAGHCLFSGIASPERARRVAETLLAPESFSGWGIRTLAACEHRYNPMSYHNGSVWPHDNALVAAGFARYGLTGAAATVLTALFDASRFFDLHRMPELFCGFHRRPGDGPTSYPVACAPQAWASAAVFLLIDAVLQLRLDSASETACVDAVDLPHGLDSITFENLELSGGRVDLRVDRRGAGIEVSSSLLPR